MQNARITGLAVCLALTMSYEELCIRKVLASNEDSTSGETKVMPWLVRG
jgi:hypothetical protein